MPSRGFRHLIEKRPLAATRCVDLRDGSGAWVGEVCPHTTTSPPGGSAVRTVCHPPCDHGSRGTVRARPPRRTDPGRPCRDGRRRPRWETGAAEKRLQDLPSRVVVSLLLAAALFPTIGYGQVWTTPTSGLDGLETATPTTGALASAFHD
nr:transposase domain-containing protein [Frankia sp. Cj5]